MELKSYILITGASSGIGREIAVLLSENHNLIVNGRDETKLKETISLCNQSHNHLIWAFDLVQTELIEESLTQLIVDKKGAVSAFIHSAGYLKMLPLKMLQPEHFRFSFDVNVISAAIIAKILVKKKINDSHLKNIVFISSNISNFGAKAFSVYTASKAALDGMMRCLAIELGPTVRVNSVLPGGVKTVMTESMYENSDLISRMEAKNPLGVGFARDIAGAVNFLISDDARWITGQQLTVDGGRTINITG
jgi:NAD(P)-dependent dehydrogenase (short-subunit alcohol dehydrogenase family)